MPGSLLNSSISRATGSAVISSMYPWYSRPAMKVLLNESLKNVGRAGEIKEVKNGYARNYLIPRGLAAMATVGTLKQAEERRQSDERREAKNQTANQALAARVGAAKITLRARVG